jgi:hypothetical protein
MNKTEHVFILLLTGQEDLTGAKDEEVILSARTNAKPTL